MEMHQIRYFLTLCKELNFTRAAERCDVAQSSLTRAIKSLETDLGGALFHRERGNTNLSALGEKVRPSLEQVFHHATEAERRARDFTRERAASLRLGVMRNLAPPQPMALIAAMRQHHRDLSLQIVEASSQDLQNQLISDDLDAAIYALPNHDADERMNRLILDSESFVVVVSERHPSQDRVTRISEIYRTSRISRASIATMSRSFERLLRVQASP